MQRMGATAAAAAFKHPFGFRTSPDGQSAVRCLPFRARTHPLYNRSTARRRWSRSRKVRFAVSSSHKATLVNQPEMLITEEGGRADGQRREGGWRKGRHTIDRSRERASERGGSALPPCCFLQLRSVRKGRTHWPDFARSVHACIFGAAVVVGALVKWPPPCSALLLGTWRWLPIDSMNLPAPLSSHLHN